MSFKLLNSVLLLLIISVSCFSQNSIYVSDDLSKEGIPEVLLKRIDGTNIGFTDNEGYISLNEAPESQIVFLHIGYHADTLSVSEIRAQHYKIYLKNKFNTLSQVVISASKFKDTSQHVPYKMTIIDLKALRENSTQNAADLIQETGQVYVQKSQMGGGSPVLRGFEANRVLLVVDGVRMNNAIYRGGHLQNILTIDPEAQDRVEVLYGPSSVIYGSDALGGVIHFQSRPGIFGHDSVRVFHGNALIKYNSANQGQSFHGDVLIGLRNLALFSSATVSYFESARSGENKNPFNDTQWLRTDYVDRINGRDSIIQNPDPFHQLNTGYQQMDLVQKVSFYSGSKLKHTFCVQYSKSTDIPRYDRLIRRTDDGNLQYAKWNYGPQKRLLSYYNLGLTDLGKLADEAQLILSYQNIEESRITRRFRNPIETNRIENLHIGGLNFDLRKDLTGSHKIQYGLDMYVNTVDSDAFNIEIRTNTQNSEVNTRYPDGGSVWRTYGAYFQHKWIYRKLRIQEGIRFSAFDLSASIEDTNLYKLPFNELSQRNSAVSASLGVDYLVNKKTALKWALSSGFRAPNLDDAAKIFDSNPGNVIVPNEDLRPEQVISTEINAERKITKHIKITANVYYSWVLNLIKVGEFTLGGSDSIFYDGELSNVQANINSDRAYMYGGFLDFSIIDLKRMYGNVSLNYTKGYDITENVPMAHIPPFYGKVLLGWKMARFPLDHQIFSHFNGQKKRKDYNPSGADRLQFATPEGMPAWFTLNYKLAYSYKSKLEAQVGINNILDTHYRLFASGISAPGRHFFISIRYNI